MGDADPLRRTSAPAPSTTDEPSQLYTKLKTMPIMLSVVTLIYVLITPIAALVPAPFGEDTGQFLGKQLAINSSMLVLLAMLYGMVALAYPKGWFARFQNLFLPAFLILAMWLKCFFTYQQGLKTHCTYLAEQSDGLYTPGTQPYMLNTLMWNTSKVPIAILAVYIFVILFPPTLSPFFQFFSGDEDPHPLCQYFAIGFWTGCAAWASEASCFFQLVRSGCRPYDNISFETIATVETSS